VISNHPIVSTHSDTCLCYLVRTLLQWFWHWVPCECRRLGDCCRCLRTST